LPDVGGLALIRIVIIGAVGVRHRHHHHHYGVLMRVGPRNDGAPGCAGFRLGDARADGRRSLVGDVSLNAPEGVYQSLPLGSRWWTCIDAGIS
jgi:hypothetical protein